MSKERKKRIDIVSLKMVHEKSMLYSPRRINKPEVAADLIRKFIAERDRECLIGIYLNIKNEPTCLHEISVGSLNSSIVHPREVFKTGICANAAALIIGHNHPSGDPTPSTEDLKISRKILKAGELLGIQLLDHIIIAGNTHYSLKEEGDLRV